MNFGEFNMSFDEFKKMCEKNEAKKRYIDRAAAREAIDFNIFSEYNTLKKILEICPRDGHYDYRLGRFKTLSYMIKCIKEDPEDANWYNEENINDLKEAGQLLFKYDGTRGMHDDLVWSFIPKRYHREIDIAWDGIGNWQA